MASRDLGWLTLVAALLPGCDSTPLELFVDLRTDLVPGMEFDGMRVELMDTGARRDAVIDPAGAYLEGVRVAEFTDLAPGQRSLVVTLVDEGGASVAERKLRLEHETSFAVTVVITRDCRGVVCGDPDNETCIAGRCGSVECSERDPATCPAEECADDTECAAPSACAVGRCAAGACLFAADDSICASEEVCDVEMGCTDASAPWPGCVADVAVATISTCVLFRDGHVECSGNNDRGQLGDGTGRGSLTFVRAEGLGDAVRLSPPAWGHCALRAGGSVSCWGDGNDNRFGSLGPGFVLVPTEVPEVGVVNDFETGSTSSCAVLSDGAVACMGANDISQLGDGTTDPSATPVPVDLPGPALEVASAWEGSVVRLADGRVFSWGSAGGRIGALPREPSGGVTDAVELSAHGISFYVRRRDGTVWAWGRNTFGQLGDGTTASRAAAAPVMGLTDARSIAGGGTHACAVVAGGEVRCWGDNGVRRKLGVAGLDISTTPVTVPDLPPAAVVRAGQEHTCAIALDGTVWCWGYDSSGQMGLGDQAEGRLPVQIPITCE